jgi:hypothetical protein
MPPDAGKDKIDADGHDEHAGHEVVRLIMCKLICKRTCSPGQIKSSFDHEHAHPYSAYGKYPGNGLIYSRVVLCHNLVCRVSVI